MGSEDDSLGAGVGRIGDTAYEISVFVFTNQLRDHRALHAELVGYF